MSYSIVYNETKKTVELELKTLMDSAALITPKRFMRDGKPQGESKYSIRCLLKTDKCENFRKELAEATAKLCNGTTQIHPAFAKMSTKPQYIVRDFFKVGKEVIAEKQELDERLEKNARKNYSPALDYLNDLCYFFASSSNKFQPRLFDKFGNELKDVEEKFFEPSFIGKIRLNIKLVYVSPNTYIVPYINAIQYIAPSEISYKSSVISFGESDSGDNMFGDAVKKDSFDGNYYDVSKEKPRIKIPKYVKDAVDLYVDEFA